MNEVTALLEAFESGKLYKDSLKTKAIPNLPKYCKLSDSAVGLLIAANISYASLSVWYPLDFNQNGRTIARPARIPREN